MTNILLQNVILLLYAVLWIVHSVNMGNEINKASFTCAADTHVKQAIIYGEMSHFHLLQIQQDYLKYDTVWSHFIL